jgi:hypothetical protein
VRALVRQLDQDALQEIVVMAAEWHEDVARAVRLAAQRSTGDLAQLKTEIDLGLRTRRFLGYRESSAWAREAAPIVEEIRQRAVSAPSAELLALIERGVGHVVKVILHADDSDGMIGDLARELLEVHALLCDTGVADPIKLARWMIRFGVDDQDFFTVDPVRYSKALGERGLSAYRQEILHRSERSRLPFAVEHAIERLAVLDGDADTIVRLLGGELSNPHHFTRVAEAFAELGRDDDVLAWATRGIAETSGWQVAELYDLAVGVHERRGDIEAVVVLRYNQHRRTPSSTSYGLLRRAAEETGTWPSERGAALAVLDPGSLVDVLLAEGESEAAWQVTLDNPGWDAGPRWIRLAEAREPTHPADALTVYLRMADLVLERADRSAYESARAILQQARRAAKLAGCADEFAHHLGAIREQYRRRPTLIKILDRANLA